MSETPSELTETIPLRLEDNPSYGNFPGSFGHVRYGEGIFVGYRGYDQKNLGVAYPFGHGLSYTTFEYGEASAAQTGDGDVVVSVGLRNAGTRAGREIVQVYTALPGSLVERPVRALSGLASVALEPGESRTVQITLRRADLAYCDIRVGRWVLEGGSYTVEVAASSRDIRATTTVDVTGDEVTVPLTLHSSVTEVLADPVAGPKMRAAAERILGAAEPDKATQKAMTGFPIARIIGFTGPEVTTAGIQSLLDEANAARG